MSREMNIPRLRPAFRAVAIDVFLVVTIAAIYGQALYSHIQLATDSSVFNDDVRAQIVPFFRYESPALRGDYTSDYYLACLPVGYRGLYTAAAFLNSATTLSKSLPYVLLLVTVFSIALVAYRIAGGLAALTCTCLCLGSGTFLFEMAGGLPRSFGFPLLAGILVALAYGSIRALSLLVWLGAALYPVAGVLAGICLAMLLLDPISGDRGRAASWSAGKRIVALLGVAAIAVVILLPVGILSSRFGGLITAARFAEFPEAGPGGRYRANNQPPFWGFVREAESTIRASIPGAGPPMSGLGRWIRSDGSGRTLRTTLMILLVLSSIGWARLSIRSPEVRRITLLPVAGLAGYVLAWPLTPVLYLPSRYVTYALPPFAIVLLGAGAAGLVEGFSKRRRWLSLTAVGSVGIATLVLLGSRGSRDVGLNIRADLADPVYRFLGTLPSDSLIAGWPSDFMDNVPYLVRRRAFVTYETHQAFHVDYTLEMRRRLRALIDAFFATQPGPLMRLNREFGVTHLVVDLAVIRRGELSYFKPFDRDIEDAVRGAGGRELEILRQLDAAAVFRHGDTVVLDVGRIDASQ
jgi:hypothetical protein